MNQSFAAERRNPGQLLGEYEKRPVVVPRFQRGYSWQKEHVETLWSDIWAFHEEKSTGADSYFLGPIVVLLETDQVILLDGQQRLATLTILLSVVRDRARLLGTKGADLARDIQRTLILKEEDPDTHALKLGELDQGYFSRAEKLAKLANEAWTFK